MPIYEIDWFKYYYTTGTVMIEASTEKEAIKIVEDNIGNYDGSLNWEPDKNFIESCGEVKENEIPGWIEITRMD